MIWAAVAFFYDVPVAQGTSQPFLQTGGAMLSVSL